MLSVEQAVARVLSAFSPLASEIVPLGSGLGRVLAEDVQAMRDQPPRAVSAMDGYAVRAADLAAGSARLQVIGEAPAGGSFTGVVQVGQTVRIFTGGPLPDCADTVAMQENARPDGEAVDIQGALSPGTFVRPAGLDFRRGDVGIDAHTVLGARHLGLAASMGHGWLRVRRRPRIAVLATGNELVLPGATPAPEQISSSNTAALAAMIRVWGGDAIDLGIASDSSEAVTEAASGIQAFDALVTTGGASVGEHDLVLDALRSRGFELDFWRVAMRPGKPVIFGHLQARPVLGLPGNPVSASVCSLVFLRAAMRRMLGLDPTLEELPARLGAPLGANDLRQEYLRCRCEIAIDGVAEATPAPRQDSSMFATFARADRLIVREPEAPAVDIGATVRTVPLSDAALAL